MRANRPPRACRYGGYVINRVLSVGTLLLVSCAHGQNNDKTKEPTAGVQGEKHLPAVTEPDWSTWKQGDSSFAEAWNIIIGTRPDRDYKNQSEYDEAVKRFETASKKLESNREAACAAGADILHETKDDFSLLVVSFHLKELGGKRADPFVLWAMPRAKSIDLVYHGVFNTAIDYAAHKTPQYLPAVFTILRAKDGRMKLDMHAWMMYPWECVYYVMCAYGKDVIPYLYPMLRHDDAYVRRNAAMAMGVFFEDAAIPILKNMLDSGDAASGGAAFALSELGVTETIPKICMLLKNADPLTRYYAAYALCELGSKEAIPALKEALSVEKDEITGREIAGAIEQINQGVPALGDKAHRLSSEELDGALVDAEAEKGLDTELALSIMISANKSHLGAIDRIRTASTQVLSDKGNKAFRIWGFVMKELRSGRKWN